jgi:acyl phosphate:glycerol-3-phosphate acyltransferase
MLYPIIILSAYCIGSFPTAYFVVKRMLHIDIRSAGSGNVGGYNTYEVSGSRAAGLLVTVLDAVKGALAVGAVSFLVADNPTALVVSFLAVVVGHCFPVWLRFKGGRGLATAGGAMLVIAWPFVIIWMFWWLVTYLAVENIHVGNVMAVAFMLGLALLLPDQWLLKMIRPDVDQTSFLLMMTVLSGILLARHFIPIIQLIQYNKKT